MGVEAGRRCPSYLKAHSDALHKWLRKLILDIFSSLD